MRASSDLARLTSLNAQIGELARRLKTRLVSALSELRIAEDVSYKILRSISVKNMSFEEFNRKSHGRMSLLACSILFPFLVIALTLVSFSLGETRDLY